VLSARRAPRLATIEAGRLTLTEQGTARRAPQLAQQGARGHGERYGRQYDGQGY
jgi:putative ABC transport system ATP-binding protein